MDDRHSDSAADDATWDALARYDAGECEPAEAEAAEQWLAAHPGDAAALGALSRGIARMRPSDVTEADVANALRVVKQRTVQRPWQQKNVYRMAIAAGIAAAAAGLAAGYAINRSHGASRIAPVSSVAGAAAARSFTTAVGAHESVLLSDGTRVNLGPGSSLSVPAGYGTTHRDVALTGEAFFVAAHNAVRPFTVRVDGAMIRDIGTAFDVRADRPGAVRVTVVSGTVVLRVGTDSTGAPGETLHAGDVGVAEGLKARVVARRPIADSTWNPNQLTFDDAPMSEVRDAFRRWYGVDISIDPSIAGRHVSAAFTTEPAKHVIDVIAKTIGATAEWRNGNVTLHDALAPAR